MNAKVAKAYANNEVESSVISSDSKELVVLVYERVLDNLKIGKCALENGEVIPKLVTFVLEGSWAEDENGKIS